MPADLASERGKGWPSISKPYIKVGTRNTPIWISQRVLVASKINPMTAPRIKPPGQPACRMLSQWVLFSG
jgi:hypothetical protein